MVAHFQLRRLSLDGGEGLEPLPFGAAGRAAGRRRGGDPGTGAGPSNAAAARARRRN